MNYRIISLLRRFEGIKKTLHARFFPGCGVLLDNPLPCGSIYFLYHLLEGRFSLSGIIFLGQGGEFFRAGPDGALGRLIPEPPLLTLPMTLFSGTAFTCQRKTPNYKILL
jgi:hypothetical protein